MANRFWVGGTGTWDSSSTTHWSTSSGGSNGASAPGSGDTAIFDTNSGGGTVTASGPGTIGAVNMSAAAAMTFAGTGTVDSFNIAGNFSIGANVTWTATIPVVLVGATCSFTSNGVTIASDVQVGYSALALSCVLTLADALSTTGDITVSAGTFDANGFAFSCRDLVIQSNASSKTLTLGTATHTIGRNFTINEVPGGDFTLTASTGKLVFTDTDGFNAANDNTYEVNDIDVTSLASGNASIGLTCRHLSFTGSTGGAWINSTIVKGNLTLASGMSAATSNKTFAGSSGTQVITSNGVTINGGVTINASGATVQLADALVMGSTRTLTLTNGTFNANNQTVTAGAFSSNNSNTRTVTMGSGLWTLAGTGTVWNLATTTGLTFNKDTANIKLTNASATTKTFAGGGLTYNDVWFAPGTGSGTLVITGANTFDDFRDNDGTVAHQQTWPAGVTNTFTSFTVAGTSGQLISLRSSSAGSAATLSQASGTVNSDYLNIMDSTATGGATWNAGDNSINSGNNTGWIFADNPVTQSYGIIIF